MELFNEILGAEVAVPQSPRRIVSFSPAATEALFMLGLGERVAGVSAFCARPAEAASKRRLGSYSTVRDDVLDEVAPDLVLTVTGYQREFAARLSKRYPTYPLELPVSVAGIADFVIKVGLVSGVPDRARELGGSLLRELGRMHPITNLTGYIEIDLGGPVSFGAYSYITDAFHLLGCKPLYGESRSEWVKPDLEEVRALDPDVIVYEPKMFSRFTEENLDKLIASRGWERLKARRARNVFLTPGPLDFFAHHGPSFITGALPWLEQKLMEARERVVP